MQLNAKIDRNKIKMAYSGLSPERYFVIKKQKQTNKQTNKNRLVRDACRCGIDMQFLESG